MSENEVALRQQAQEMPLTVRQMQEQVNLIQGVMKEVMKKDEHYGKIPGCGDKPTLLKPGAEKLMFTFQLVADPDVEIIDLSHPEAIDGHREYRVKTSLSSRSGVFLGAGVGSCSTMEGKYRFRTGPTEFTGKKVPNGYWKDRDKSLIGGSGFVTKKDEDGIWMIAIQGKKVENESPAD